MSKRTKDVSGEERWVPDLILVSEKFTNGLYHHTKDIDKLTDALLEHVLLNCFIGTSFPDKPPSSEYLEAWIGDFALYRIDAEMGSCLQFRKREPIMFPLQLYTLVESIREDPATFLESVPVTQAADQFLPKLAIFNGKLKTQLLSACRNYLESPE